MPDYPYRMQLAEDASAPGSVARGALISFYASTDTAGTSLLALKDPSGNPLGNPLTTTTDGFVPALIAPVDEIRWEGGGFHGFLTSYEGLKAEAVAAAAAADSAHAAAAASAAAAVEAAQFAQSPTDIQVDAGIARANIPETVAQIVAQDETVAAAAAVAVDGALADVSIITEPVGDQRYLAVPVAGSLIPSGGSLVTFGDGSASAGHFATLLSAAHSLAGWPGAAGVNRRGNSASTAIAETFNTLGSYTPHQSSVVIVRAPLVDQGVAGDNLARKGYYERAIRTQLAIFRADSRVEETASAFAFGTGFTAVTGDSTWSGGNNKFGSGASFVDVTIPAQDTYVLLGASSNATGALIQVTDQNTATSLGTISTAATLPSGSSGPFAYRVPPAARGHVLRFARVSGTTSLTVDAMLPQATTPPLIVLIKAHYANDYSSLTGGTLGSDAAVNAFNAVIDSVVADFPGVIVINPNNSATGWVRATHAAASGFEYTPAGHAKMAQMIEAATALQPGTAGLTRAVADTLYAPASVSVSEGPLLWTDPRIGGILEDPSLVTLIDQTSRWNVAMGLLAARGGVLTFPGLGGVVGFAGTTSHVPGGATVEGSGFDYSETNTASPRFGTVLRATAAMQRLVQLGANGSGSSTAPGVTGGSIRHLSIDGRNLAEEVVTTQARRNYIDTCQVAWGNTRGIGIHGQNTYVVGKGVVIQNDRGDCITIDSYYDHKVFDWELREMGATGAAVRVAATSQGIADITISRIHAWAGANGVGKPAQGLVVLDAQGFPIQNVNVTDCILEGIEGPEMLMRVNNSGLITNVKINGMQAFNYDSDSADPAILVVGSGGSIVDLVAVGNSFAGNGPVGEQYSAFVEYQGTFASTGGWDIGSNTGRYMAAHVLGTPPNMPNFSGAFPILNGSGRVYARREGSVALNGGGSGFSIPHFLSRAPRTVSVTPGSAAAAAPFYVTSDATNIVVTYTSATAAGTGNIALNWSAAI